MGVQVLGFSQPYPSTRYYRKYYAREDGEVDSGRRTGMEQLQKVEWSVPLVQLRERVLWSTPCKDKAVPLIWGNHRRLFEENHN